MTADAGFYSRALDRMGKAMLVLTAAGSLAALAWQGWTWGLGFLAGSALSWFNFRSLKGVAESLGGERPKRRSAIAFASRYLLIGGGAYVIVKYSKISLQAALAGLFVSAAAVIVEIIFQLVYERN